MLETPHVAVGAAISYFIPNPLISIPLAFLSHFVMERVPHWNPHLNTEIKEHGKITDKSINIIIIDSTSALLLGSFIAFSQYPDIPRIATILIACFFSVLPDLVEAPYFFLNIKTRGIEKWMKFQKSIQVDAGPKFGIFTQIVTVIASLLWIFSGR